MFIDESMADPIFSPDGKFMWTGSEWIPAPPVSPTSAQSTVNLQDSMMSGDVNIEQNSSEASTAINLRDSAMSGDINITQNKASDIIDGIEHLLKRMGYAQHASTSREAEEELHEDDDELDLSGAVKYIETIEKFAQQRLIDVTRLREIFGLDPVNLTSIEVEEFEAPLVVQVEYWSSEDLDPGIIDDLNRCLERLRDDDGYSDPSLAYIDCLEYFMHNCGCDLDALRARFGLEPAYN